MSPGTLVKILHNKEYGLTSDFLDFGFGRGINISERTGLILNLSKVPGLHDVYDVLLDNGMIVSIEDRLLQRIDDDKEKTDSGGDR